MIGVFPATPVDFIKFIAMPFTVTIQLPILFMMGSGWLFVTVTGLLWIGISCLLKWAAKRKGGDSLREAGEN